MFSLIILQPGWLIKLASSYKEKGGYVELARRYCRNILMGEWLWRNRQTLGTRIEVLTSNNKIYIIDDARELSWDGPWSAQNMRVLNGLAGEVAVALSDSSVFWFADITATLKTSFCQEIHPSQKFTENLQMNESSRQLSTTMCSNGVMAACFHAEKVGAAVHFIDDWWTESADKRLRVHEYGADARNMIAHRHPLTHQDFYSLVKKTVVYIRQLRSSTAGDGSDISPEIHYLMSVLIKAGMFQKGKG